MVPDSSVGKESACNVGDPGLIPGLERSAGEGMGYPRQYSWASLWFSWWRIHLQCGRPGLNPWIGKIPWRRERLSTPVFWPGEFHGLYSRWGHIESHKTEWLSLSLLNLLIPDFLIQMQGKLAILWYIFPNLYCPKAVNFFLSHH